MEPCHTLLKICHLYSFVSLIHIVVHVPRWISSNTIYSLLRQGSSPITKQHDGMLRAYWCLTPHRSVISCLQTQKICFPFWRGFPCDHYDWNRHQESSSTFNPTYLLFPTPQLLKTSPVFLDASSAWNCQANLLSKWSELISESEPAAPISLVGESECRRLGRDLTQTGGI